MTSSEEAGEGGTPARCPICGKPAVAASRPFCSKRCADVDLHRWLSGRYAIPVGDDPEAPAQGSDEDEGALSR